MGGGVATASVAALWPRIAAAQGRPARILLVGDSMIAGAFGLFLAQALRETHGWSVHREGKSSTGLSRPDFFDWISRGKQLAEVVAPFDATVCMFGGNDGQGLFMGKKAEPRWIRYGEEGWDEEYRRRVVAFADAVTPPGGSLHWIGMPVMGPEKLHRRMRHLNRIYRGETCICPRCHFIDVWRDLADARGRYTKRMKVDGKRTSVRADDGVHLTVKGAKYLVGLVAPRIAGRVATGGDVRTGPLGSASAGPAEREVAPSPGEPHPSEE